jgi:hypothetical protein
MVRIILEDIKLNKEKRQVVEKIDEVETAESLNPKINIYKEEKADITDSKIDEYFKKRSTGKQRLERTPQIRTKKRIVHRPVAILFILCVIIGGIYIGGEHFQKANITITPKHQIITYNEKLFTASKESLSGAIDFEIMIISDKKTKSIILTEPKDVSVKATGSVTLFNEFATIPQKLSVGTFIADEAGKTYKIDSTVTIPGYKLDTNKKIVPGQVVVNISAFLAGESYNGSPSNFYITSFKKTTKYNKIYGKLKTPLVGGAAGLVYTLDDASKNNIDNIAQSSIKSDLLKQVEALVPEGYILYPNAMTFSYTSGDNIFSKTPNAEIEINGTLAVVLLKENSLMNNITKVSLPEIKGEELKEISIVDLSKLTFNFTNKDQQITKDLTSIPFSFSGSVDAIWKPNIGLLKSKLLGIEKNNISLIFATDPGISSAVAKISPFWQSYVPKDLTKINIILK